MKKFFYNLTIDRYQNSGRYSESDIKIMNYGFETFYSLTTKTIVILLISILLNTFWETIFLIIFYYFLRRYSFGFHAASNLGCWISTSLIYSVIPLIIKNFEINYYVGISLSLISGIILIIYSPADTMKRPLISQEKRNFNKFIVILISCIYLIFIFQKSGTLTSILIVSMMIQAACTNPIVFKLFKQPFNNYKNYNVV